MNVVGRVLQAQTMAEAVYNHDRALHVLRQVAPSLFCF